MARQKTYYVEWGGYCTLIEARDEDHARRKASATYGSINDPYRVRLATAEDRSWVAAMSGGGIK